ncbi:MAG TPA: hypothetical protein VFM66_07535 [Agromyces sp.]|nr:hypothetical protein [Agromyces sp.]
MTDPNPTDLNADELEKGVAAAEQHQRADQDADADEKVVIRDPETGATKEEQAQ